MWTKWHATQKSTLLSGLLLLTKLMSKLMELTLRYLEWKEREILPLVYAPID